MVNVMIDVLKFIRLGCNYAQVRRQRTLMLPALRPAENTERLNRQASVEQGYDLLNSTPALDQKRTLFCY